MSDRTPAPWDPLAGWRQLESGRAPRVWATQPRRCEIPDCLTRLSRYNPSTVCGAHGGWQRAGAA
jgi:hypothetical protein